ncbi:MAG: hypothetical protein A2374_02080 [Candidatus Moranbacteria bacterium RIFOXYB1_FULL_44_23]|nr:MAG: hypothetical protein A2374_02080 [Candidatus Moranbacteria bacterium RIFOXYB1_FULL_44_23]OGI43416.1 MAG: hypothetical protein A2593_03375 [Candidatus Moranbacteria bacterium RIFOXYD1_FULL_44_9]HBB36970.1 hypothetical protein [Candidatus Moranbacteria bacterium]HBU25017.1 hypothetical protein [Candidatus Moranbacteria bacterium]
MFASRNMVNSRENSDLSQKIPVKTADLKSVVESLLDSLSAKQKLVLSSRFGIGNGQPKTLEAIGKNLNITRERVRQIEGDAVKALKKTEKVSNLDNLSACVNDIIKENGGIIKAEKLASGVFLRYTGNEKLSLQEAKLLEVIFLMTGIKKARSNREMEDTWIHPDFDKKYFKAAVDELEMIFDTGKKILTLEEVLKKLDHSEFSQKYSEMKPEHILSFLEISKKFGQNVFGDWGKARWPLIRPRGVREKATLVLMKKGKPLHFREISQLIEELKLSGKKVHPQTVHNELIRDKRFVLVGRGTYALREWGFEEGTVKDVIVNLLNSAGGFLKREKLYEEVLGKRKVKRATIAVNLANRKVFEKKADGYKLR